MATKYLNNVLDEDVANQNYLDVRKNGAGLKHDQMEKSQNYEYFKTKL